jgi:hypothetical protein
MKYLIKNHPWVFAIIFMMAIIGIIIICLQQRNPEIETQVEGIDLEQGGSNEYVKAYTDYINDPYPLEADGGPKPAEYARRYMDRAKRNTFGKPKRAPASP